MNKVKIDIYETSVKTLDQLDGRYAHNICVYFKNKVLKMKYSKADSKECKYGLYTLKEMSDHYGCNLKDLSVEKRIQHSSCWDYKIIYLGGRN